MSDIRKWLGELGLGAYGDAFAHNDIDESLLPDLTDEALEKLGVASMGHRMKILRAARGINDENQSNPHASPAATTASSDAERRQLTVMFCDLVGSTALSERLDPEDLRQLISTYRRTAGDVVARYDGHVAQYLGDGLMVYFGWPRAHEDDAERAVRAALEIVEAVKQVSAPDPLKVRLGIATGAVVVGEGSDENSLAGKLAVGETPNLAARLQGLAGPGEIVIGPGTRHLTRGTFDYADLGSQTLKGILDPVPTWRVVGESGATDRFEAHAADRLTPFVGRDSELALLVDRWHQAGDGEGQVVLLSGEPGIGKSRIFQELRTRLSGAPYTQLRYQCSPYHINSALHPIITQFEHAAGFDREDASDVKLDKMEDLLAKSADGPAVVRLFASLLGLPIDRYPPMDLSPQRQKDQTLKALVDQVVALADDLPVLLILEDAHWIDPTTQEVFDMLIDAIIRHRVLVLITFRPEFEPPWINLPHVTPVSLKRLARRHGAAMVAKVTGDKALPDAVLDQIIAKTDGIPLFVEELTKTILASGDLEKTSVDDGLSELRPDLTVPSTLQDSLMARLDRLEDVKEIAQIGACIGREFSYEMIVAASPMASDQLDDALEKLIETELVHRRGQTFTFKHALVQDAAYMSLLRENRRAIHELIANALKDHVANDGHEEPETIARHFSRAGRSEAALPYWLDAARNARSQSAHQEAIGHLRSGLALLEDLPESSERNATELDFQAILAPLILMTAGWASADGAAAFERARVLCEEIKDDPHFPYVLAGLSNAIRWHGKTAEAKRLVDQLFDLARTTEKADHLLLAHTMHGQNLMFEGRMQDALTHYEEALTIHDPSEHRDLSQFCGFDPAMLAISLASYMKWHLGYPDQASAMALESMKMADDIGHPVSLAYAYAIPGADLHYFMRDLQAIEAFGERALALCAEHGGFAQFATSTDLHLGWVMIQRGNVEAGLSRMVDALAGWLATGASAVIGSRHVAEVAEAHGLAGQAEQGLQILANSPDRLRNDGKPVRYAEIYRIEAELHLAKPEPDSAEAERLFLEAIAIGREEGSICWELRSAVCLARLWQSQDKTAEAHDLLSPVYDQFTEGFDTRDLKEAKALLDALT